MDPELGRRKRGDSQPRSYQQPFVTQCPTRMSVPRLEAVSSDGPKEEGAYEDDCKRRQVTTVTFDKDQ
jgi:hypothetical protein